MRVSREFIGIFVLLALFVAAGLAMSGQRSTESREVGADNPPDPSIYNDRGTGSMAFFDFVNQLGYSAEPWRESWGNLGNSNALMMMIVQPDIEDSDTLTGDGSSNEPADATTLTAADAKTLFDWLRPGRTAVLFVSRMMTGRVAGSSDGQDYFGDALGLYVDSTATGGAQSDFMPLQPTPLADGVISVYCTPGVRITTTDFRAVGLFGDKNGPVVAALPVGKGRLIVVADGAFAENSNLGRSENAVFLGDVLSRYAKPGGTVLFDEFHHGDTDALAGGDLWPALGRPLQLAIIQLLLALVVVIGVVGVRFGDPLPLMRSTGRTSAEYVGALASLYFKAGASIMALEMIYRQFLRELTLRLGLSTDINLEQLAVVAGKRGGIDSAEIRRVLASCEHHIDTGRVTEPELLDLVRRMERIRKDIGIV